MVGAIIVAAIQVRAAETAAVVILVIVELILKDNI